MIRRKFLAYLGLAAPAAVVGVKAVQAEPKVTNFPGVVADVYRLTDSADWDDAFVSPSSVNETARHLQEALRKLRSAAYRMHANIDDFAELQ
jgi:hypothetical protein